MKKIKLSKIALSVLISVVGISQINAANLTAWSGSPAVNFVDTDYHPTNTAYTFSATYLSLTSQSWVHINDYVFGGDLFSIRNDSNDIGRKAFISNSSGDINLANGSVWIDKSENNVGIGTTAPDAGLHIVNTETIIPPQPSLYTYAEAALKLETKDGFDWSLMSRWSKPNIIIPPFGTPTNTFYIKDDTANTFPFGIRGGAASSTLFINSNSKVGIGTSSPQAKLDVRGTIKSTDKITTTWSGSNAVDDGLTTLVSLSANNAEAGKASDAGFALVNAGENFQWNFRTLEYRDAFTATKEGSGGGEFVVQSPTNDFKDAIMKVGGKIIFEGGHVVTASSRELKTDIKPLDTQAAMDAFHKLQPVSFAYKTHKDEPVVGFIAEDIPELVAMPSRKTFDSAEVVAVLTSVLAETRAEMEAMRAEIAELKAMKER